MENKVKKVLSTLKKNKNNWWSTKESYPTSFDWLEDIFTSVASSFDLNDTEFSPDEQDNTVSAEWTSIHGVKLVLEANYVTKICKVFRFDTKIGELNFNSITKDKINLLREFLVEAGRK